SFVNSRLIWRTGGGGFCAHAAIDQAAARIFNKNTRLMEAPSRPNACAPQYTLPPRDHKPQRPIGAFGDAYARCDLYLHRWLLLPSPHHKRPACHVAAVVGARDAHGESELAGSRS